MIGQPSEDTLAREADHAADAEDGHRRLLLGPAVDSLVVDVELVCELRRREIDRVATHSTRGVWRLWRTLRVR
jgi:hypothetical protein